MSGDLLGGLMKGLSGLMPQDDPDVKILQAQAKVNDLKKEENKLYAQLGRQVMEEERKSIRR